MDWLNYHHLLYFWMTTREGTVSAAAEALHLSRPTVTGQLRELERALGQRLFEKKGRRLVLTEFGQRVHEYADTIFRTGRELQAFVRGNEGSGRSQLLVGMPDDVPKLIAFRLLRPALHLIPKVRTVCCEGKLNDLLADLALHRLDLVLSDVPASPAIEVKAFSHKLGESGLSIVAIPRLAALYRDGFPRSLHKSPMLLPTERTACRARLALWFDTHGIEPEVVAEFQDPALLKVFGHAGEGLFPVPTAIEQDVMEQYRVELVGRLVDVREQYFAITVEKRIKQPAVMAVVRAGRDTIFN